MGEWGVSLAETVIVAAGEIVKKHSFLSVNLKRCGVNAKTLGDRICNNSKALAKLVDKAENNVAVPYGRPNYK